MPDSPTTTTRPPTIDTDQANARPRSTSNAASPTIGRSNTLKKRTSVSRRSSLRPASSRKSLRGSVAGISSDYNSSDFTPIPTHGSPTDILAERFQSWRTYLKALITYFREVQTSYDTRSKAIVKVSNVISNAPHPIASMSEGGLADATQLLSQYHKHAATEAAKVREIQEDVIQALQGLRSDLSAKVKEIKALHGDFRNSIDKEKDATKKAISALEDALNNYDHHDEHHVAKNDPFIVRLGVDRMVEKQIDEENYLHRAYLNLESSGRELESIIVGEIQKAYNAFAGILKREADHDYEIIESLRAGPIAMPKDFEWRRFVMTDSHFVNPDLPVRKVSDIEYPGKSHPATTEIRAGMLERKSKYLKSYSPGWYILSPTHLHEFKSADNIYSQPPIMSLYLTDQKLGSHSDPGSSSHKFMLKGRQTGGVHRGHSWVFRAESYETMMAWYDAIKVLTEKTGAERNAYVRQRAKSISAGSAGALSTSSGEIEEDEADIVPYSASIKSHEVISATDEQKVQRPLPGGRFPSDLAIPRIGRPSTDSTSDIDNDAPDRMRGAHSPGTASASDTPPTSVAVSRLQDDPYRIRGIASHSSKPSEELKDIRPAYLASSERAYPDSLDGVGEAKIPQVAPASTIPLVTREMASPQATVDASSNNPSDLPHTSVAPIAQVQPEDTSTAVASANTDRAHPPGAQMRQDTYYGGWLNSSSQKPGPENPESAATKDASAGPVLTTTDSTLTHPELATAAPAGPSLLTVPGAGAPAGSSSSAAHTGSLGPPSAISGPSLAPTSAASLGNSSWTSSPGDQGFGTATTALDGSRDTQDTATNGAGASSMMGLVRNQTGSSISNLHVPGEFPKSAAEDKKMGPAASSSAA